MTIDDSNNPPVSGGATAQTDLTAKAREDLSGVTDKAKQDLDDLTQKDKEDAREFSHQASEKVAEVTETAKSFAAQQKGLAAGQIHGVAAAITKVADELDGSDQQVVSRYARDLATGLTNMGKTIEDRDVDDLMGLAQDFGRKQPVAFLGAAALAGFVASRFALASAQRRDNKPTAPAATNDSRDRPTSSYSYGQSAVNRTGDF